MYFDSSAHNLIQTNANFDSIFNNILLDSVRFFHLFVCVWISCEHLFVGRLPFDIRKALWKVNLSYLQHTYMTSIMHVRHIYEIATKSFWSLAYVSISFFHTCHFWSLSIFTVILYDKVMALSLSLSCLLAFSNECVCVCVMRRFSTWLLICLDFNLLGATREFYLLLSFFCHSRRPKTVVSASIIMPNTLSTVVVKIYFFLLFCSFSYSRRCSTSLLILNACGIESLVTIQLRNGKTWRKKQQKNAHIQQA